jgi:hypothetical protein
MGLADMFKEKMKGKSLKFSPASDEAGADDEKDIPKPAPDHGEPVAKDEPGDEQPGDNGLALKHALDSGDGSAIEELIKKICA